MCGPLPPPALPLRSPPDCACLQWMKVTKIAKGIKEERVKFGACARVRVRVCARAPVTSRTSPHTPPNTALCHAVAEKEKKEEEHYDLWSEDALAPHFSKRMPTRIPPRKLEPPGEPTPPRHPPQSSPCGHAAGSRNWSRASVRVCVCRPC